MHRVRLIDRSKDVSRLRVLIDPIGEVTKSMHRPAIVLKGIIERAALDPEMFEVCRVPLY